MSQHDIQLTDPSFYGSGDPHSIWRQMREEDPVHWTEGRLSRGFWSITRYDDAKFVFLHDKDIFSVQMAGANLPAGPEFENPDDSLFTRLTQSAQQLATMDGEAHYALRRYFAKKFTSNAVDGLRSMIREISDSILPEILEREECDFTVEYAGRLPAAVISAMLGVPVDMWKDFYRWNNMLAAPEDPEFSIGTPVDTSTAAVTNIMNSCIELANKRRRNPADDLLTALVEAEIDGKRLTDTQIGFNGLMFFAAGHETTRASMSTGVLELLKDRAQLEWLRSNRHDTEIMKIAAEEFVRYSSPLTHTLRTVTRDVEVGGQLLKEGDWAVVWFHPANRDGRIFRDPERFDVRRNPNPHLGFAVGKHFCLGAYLARLDMAVMLDAVLEHMRDLELSSKAEWASSNLFWGIKHMPVRFRSGRGLAASVG